MEQYSISFTLGKASAAHGANLAHNNRLFFAQNVFPLNTHQNITYVSQSPEQAYQILFQEAVDKYNEDQNRPCRKITNYLEHITNGKREEAFYEIVVQLGDYQNTPCNSSRGTYARNMLEDYFLRFQQRNPNLYVFNAVLHMDEASPHLHIDFIPYYTKPRKRGLEKGVSMRAALSEQGFQPKNQNQNQLELWEKSERDALEQVLHKFGFVREDKHAHYMHMSVEEYKTMRDSRQMEQRIRKSLCIPQCVTPVDTLQQLKLELGAANQTIARLEHEKKSPFKSFYYSQEEKRAYVTQKLEQLGIAFRDTENGFEAQECYLQQIREIEKTYQSSAVTARNVVCDMIDRTLMRSQNIQDFWDRLERQGYQVKRGKYLSVKPPKRERFIRLKSLGEWYSEYALENRLQAKQKFEALLTAEIDKAKENSTSNIRILETMQFYIISFAKNALPVHKKETEQPFSWTNDLELDKLLKLNRTVNGGATLESLRVDFQNAATAHQEAEKALAQAETNLRTFYEIKEKIEIVYCHKHSDLYSVEQAKETLRQYPAINAYNYGNADSMIAQGKKAVQDAAAKQQETETALKEKEILLATAEKVTNGSFVQELVEVQTRQQRSNYLDHIYEHILAY